MWTQTKKKNDIQSTEYVLHVNILGIWKYDKASFDPDAFRLEKYIFAITPLVIVAIMCSILGAFACRFIDQIIERKSLTKPDQ